MTTDTFCETYWKLFKVFTRTPLPREAREVDARVVEFVEHVKSHFHETDLKMADDINLYELTYMVIFGITHDISLEEFKRFVNNDLISSHMYGLMKPAAVI